MSTTITGTTEEPDGTEIRVIGTLDPGEERRYANDFRSFRKTEAPRLGKYVATVHGRERVVTVDFINLTWVW